ncbi:hypothetical protein EAE99_009462 [Botrytis elliptica]|nr:hypothetical protein EAE99_009462 [Botrytis elliptica]
MYQVKLVDTNKFTFRYQGKALVGCKSLAGALLLPSVALAYAVYPVQEVGLLVVTERLQDRVYSGVSEVDPDPDRTCVGVWNRYRGYHKHVHTRVFRSLRVLDDSIVLGVVHDRGLVCHVRDPECEPARPYAYARLQMSNGVGDPPYEAVYLQEGPPRVDRGVDVDESQKLVGRGVGLQLGPCSYTRAVYIERYPVRCHASGRDQPVDKDPNGSRQLVGRWTVESEVIPDPDAITVIYRPLARHSPHPQHHPSGGPRSRPS